MLLPLLRCCQSLITQQALYVAVSKPSKSSLHGKAVTAWQLCTRTAAVRISVSYELLAVTVRVSHPTMG